jgi:preprotein translocase subunit SecE
MSREIGSQAPTSPSSSFLPELFQAQVYKRTQGRLVRQISCLAIMAIVGLAAWRFTSVFENRSWTLPGAVAIAAIGCWVAYRLVNWPRFADFLISVEGELAKVSWPQRPELIRASTVVITTMILLALSLFFFDAFWLLVFQMLKIAS